MTTRTRPLVQFLSTNGDGTGTTSITGDYSDATGTGAETFELVDPAGYDVWLSRLLIYVEDAGTFDADKFGNGIVLANGFTLQHLTADDDLIVDMMPVPVKTNSAWAQYCYDVRVDTYGTGNQFLAARWTFAKFHPEGLDLEDGQKLVLTVNDDLSGLINFTICCEGYIRGYGVT